MIGRENFNEAIHSLWDAKQRSLLALLGIVIGIGSVIAMVSVGEIVKNEALAQFTAMGTNLLTVQPQQGGDADTASIPFSAAQRIPKFCPSIATVAPYSSSYGQILIKGKSVSAPVLGVTEAFADLNKLPVTQGRFISDLDVLMPFCVISQKIKNALAKHGVDKPLGATLIYKGRIFTVCGVIADVPMGGMRPYEISEGIMVPISMAFRLMDRPQLQAVMARLKPKANWQTGSNQLKGYFQRTAKHMQVQIRSAQQLIQQQQKQMQLFTLLLGAIGSISLIVGGVGVMNVMLVSVTERRKEIGIRRALGAQRTDIQSQFLTESIILCITGGFIGSIVGVGAAYVLSNLNNWTFLVSWNAILVGVGVSCIVGLFFGFYPARQAARLSPIEALRSE
ncbi:ABC transporter permease [Pseudodesulfovibrio sp.]|nr:ABC transporter permease [Pseudodesulfovibrio sp.]